MWSNRRNASNVTRSIPQLEVLENRLLPSSTPLLDNLSFDVSQFNKDLSHGAVFAVAQDWRNIKSDLSLSVAMQREIASLPPADRMSADGDLAYEGLNIVGIGITGRDFDVIHQGFDLIISAAGDEFQALPLAVRDAWVGSPF